MTCLKNIGHLKLRLDGDDRLIDYNLAPLNCRRVSRISLMPYIGNTAIENIMAGPPERVVPEIRHMPAPFPDILRKHLTALRSALHLYCGDPSTSPPVDFNLEEIRHDLSGTDISGYITYDIAASEYPECDRCRHDSGRRQGVPRRRLLKL